MESEGEGAPSKGMNVSKGSVPIKGTRWEEMRECWQRGFPERIVGSLWTLESKNLRVQELWKLAHAPGPKSRSPDQESADSLSAAPERSKGRWSSQHMNCDWDHRRTYGPQVERWDVRGRDVDKGWPSSSNHSCEPIALQPWEIGFMPILHMRKLQTEVWKDWAIV